jgi:tripartite-type tricarboxylate transporter receptor subunit TctC
MRQRLLGFLMVALGAAAPAIGCRNGDEYPSRPITLVCPWSPGGGTDRVSRQVAALLEYELAVPVNVVNATGGSGVTGHTRGARAKADGYTLSMITVELNMLHWRGLTNISYRDFDPLMLLNRDDAAVFVRADSPARSLADLENEIRSGRRKLKAAGTAQGGIWHVSVAGWLAAVGMEPDDVIWVSINGAGPSLHELLAGGVDFVACSLPEASTLVEAGQIRCLGVMAAKRVAGFADVPTFRDQGVPWEMWGWRGLALPRGVPRQRKEALLAAIERVIAREDYRRFMRNAGFNAESAGPTEFAAELARLDGEFGRLLTSDAYRGVRDARYGPMVFPAAIGGLLVVVLGTILWTRKARGGAALDAVAPSSPRHRAAVVPVVVAIVAVIVFLLLLDWLGFLLTAFLLLAAAMKVLGTRWSVAIVASAAVAVVTYQLFAVAMRVSLPPGMAGW